jgi:predicted cupin superfamily sugar epimerase
MTFEDVRKLLDLTPNATCGYVRVTFVSKQGIAPGGLPAPFSEGRPAGSALYFKPVKLHRIRKDQPYHYYMGDPIEVLTFWTNSAREKPTRLPWARKRC